MTRDPLSLLRRQLDERVQRTSLARVADDLGVPIGVIRAAMAGRDLKFSSIQALARALSEPVVIPASRHDGTHRHDGSTTHGQKLTGFADDAPATWSGPPIQFLGFVRAAYDGDPPDPPAGELPAPPDLGERPAGYMRALGQGMFKEGIYPGDFLLMSRDGDPVAGDRVVYRLRGGDHRMARLVALDEASIRLRSWTANEDGAPRSVEEAVSRAVIDGLLPILAVISGEPGAEGAQLRPDPETPNVEDLGPDALARVAEALGLASGADLPAVLRAADQLRRAVAAAKAQLPALDAIRAALTEIE